MTTMTTTATPATPATPATTATPATPATVTIDCDRCVLRDSDACGDCVVTFLLDREPDDAVVIDADEARAMRLLERAGLLPSLRFEDRAG